MDSPAPSLDVRDLRVILALAEAGTTGRASRMLHLTQPAVSRALLAIEERLGVRLFERASRGLTPTPAVETLVREAPPILEALSALEQRVRAPVEPTRLRIVCECYTAYHWLPSVLARLRRSQPTRRFELAIEHTSDPVTALTEGEVDMALLTTSAVPRAFGEIALFSDEIVFVLAASHPLAKKRQLTRGDLCASTLVTSRAPVEEGRWFMKRVFGRTRPKLTFERLPLTEAILDVTRAGDGVAILSEWIAGPHLGRGDLVARRLTSGPLHRPWRLAHRRDLSPAASELGAALRQSVQRTRLAS